MKTEYVHIPAPAANDRRARKVYIRLLIVLAALLSVGMLALHAPAPEAYASTITVTNTNDSGPGSLRDAIDKAKDGDTIDFVPSFIHIIGLVSTLIITKNITIDASESSVIVDGTGDVRVFEIAPGAVVVMRYISIIRGDAGSGDGGGISVAGHLTLISCDVHRNAAANGGAVYVAANGTLIVKAGTVFEDNNARTGQGGAIFNDGVMSVSDLTSFDGNAASASGGAIVNNTNGNARIGPAAPGGGLSPVFALAPASAAATPIPPSIFAGNSVTSTSGYGGAIVNLGVMTLTNVAFFSNTGGLLGGAIYNASGGSISATLLTVISNTSTSTGGGIYNSSAMTVTDSTVMSNTATNSGAGIYNEFGQSSLLVERSLIANNSVGSGGGSGNGGGLFNGSNLTPTLRNSTVSGNTAGAGGASGGGGGLYSAFQSAGWIVLNSTIVSNTSTFVGSGGNIDQSSTPGLPYVLKNTLVGYGAPANCKSGIALTSQGHNFETANACALHASGDLTNSNPLLGPLQDNGGPSWSYALMPASPAIDKGDNAGCPATDQRGAPRPVNGGHSLTCDIGAYEYGALIAQTISFTLPSIIGLDQSPYPLGASASSNLPVTYTVTGAPCGLAGSNLMFSTKGPCTVTAHQAGNANYGAAPDVLQAITIGLRLFMPVILR